MKKKLALALSMVLMVGAFTGCSGEEAGDGTFTATDTINWVVTSSPGGGSDIYTRMISDIMITEEFIDQTVVVANKTDGNGEVGRNEVATMKGDKSDHTLLTFNSGDLMPMLLNTKNRAANFKIIAIMAVDKQLMFKGEATTHETFLDAIEAAKAGTPVIVGGSKGDDIATYEALIAEVGLTPEQMPFITHNSTGDAITALLGGHIEFVISKPAASSEYVEAGSLIPVLALSTERYTGNLADAPKLSEIGDYADVEIPVWRGVAAPAEMSDAAVTYWSDLLSQVSETEKWKMEYLDKNKLLSNYLNSADATTFVTEFEKTFMADNGIE